MSDQTSQTEAAIADDAGDVVDPHILVIVGSVRDGRMGASIASWVVEQVKTLPCTVEVLDLKEIDLPDDRHLYPGGGDVASPVAERISTADGFIFVTPEYNHSFPASLKRLIDWHYQEWQHKAALMVSYGALGGLLASEQLRAVMGELSVVTARRVVAIAQPWNQFDDETFVADEAQDGAVGTAVRELLWWSQALRGPRKNDPFVP
jgi:NAD(P)H-dependent FMN reductase